jgi:hypothetical protein
VRHVAPEGVSESLVRGLFSRYLIAWLKHYQLSLSHLHWKYTLKATPPAPYSPNPQPLHVYGRKCRGLIPFSIR